MDLFNKTKKKYNVNKSRQIKQTKQTKHKSHNIKNLRIKKIKTKKKSLYTKKNNKHRIHNSDNDNDSDNDSIKSDNKHQIGGDGFKYKAYYKQVFTNLYFTDTYPTAATLALKNEKTLPLYDTKEILSKSPIIKIKNHSSKAGTYTFTITIKGIDNNSNTVKLWDITKRCKTTFFSFNCKSQIEVAKPPVNMENDYFNGKHKFIIQINVTYKSDDTTQLINIGNNTKYLAVRTK